MAPDAQVSKNVLSLHRGGGQRDAPAWCHKRRKDAGKGKRAADARFALHKPSPPHPPALRDAVDAAAAGAAPRVEGSGDWVGCGGAE
eukprot:gene11194-biopygen3554